MGIVPSQGFNEALISEGKTEMKIFSVDTHIKSAQFEYGH